MNINEINILSAEEIKKEMKAAENSRKNHFNFIHKLSDDSLRHVEVYSGSIFIKNEKLLYSSIFDVTERYQAKKSLEENKARLELIFNSTSSMMILLEKSEEKGNYSIVSINNRGVTFFQKLKKTVIFNTFHGRTIEEVHRSSGISSLYTESFIDNCNETISSQSPVSISSHVKTEMDEQRKLEETFLPILSEHRPMVLYSSNDVTALEQTNLQLQESRQYLDMIFQSIGDAVIAADAGGNITRMNTSAEKLTGWNEVEARGKPLCKIVVLGNPGTGEKLNITCTMISAQGIYSQPGENLLLHGRDGSAHLISCTSTQVRDSQGNIQGIVLVFHDKTDEQYLRNSLKNKQELLLEAQEMAGLGYWKWDLQTNEVEWSDQVYKMFGKDPAEFSPTIESIKELSPWPESQEIFALTQKNVSQSRGQWEYDQQFLLPDGSKGYYHSTYRGIYDSTGKAVAIEGSTINITKRKQAEIAMQENKELIQAIMDNLPFGIAVTSFEPLITFHYMNDNFLRFFETTREALEKPGAFWEIAYEDAEIREKIKEQALFDIKRAGSNIVQWDSVPLKRKGRETRYVNSISIPLPGGKNNLGTLWDVTKQKKLEHELRSTIEFNEALLNSTPNLIYIYDLTEGVTIYNNRGMEHFLGFSPGKVKEKENSIFAELMHPDDYRHHRENISPRYQMAKDGEMIQNQYRMKNVDGKWKWFNAIEYVFKRNREGQAEHIFGVISDITEAKEKDEEIRNLLKEKELLLKEVHHRVKNNMNIIMNLLTIQSQSLDNPELTPSFQDAINRIRSMYVLYDKLYQTENYRKLSVKQYLSQLIDDMKNSMYSSIPVEYHLSLPRFQLDTKTMLHLGIIINELLTNSLKHAFIDKEEGVISIEAIKEGRHITIRYADNGPGIPEKRKRKKKGFGIHLIDSLVQQLNGTLSFENNKGAVYTLKFTV